MLSYYNLRFGRNLIRQQTDIDIERGRVNIYVDRFRAKILDRVHVHNAGVARQDYLVTFAYAKSLQNGIKGNAAFPKRKGTACAEYCGKPLFILFYKFVHTVVFYRDICISCGFFVPYLLRIKNHKIPHNAPNP